MYYKIINNDNSESQKQIIYNEIKKAFLNYRHSCIIITGPNSNIDINLLDIFGNSITYDRAYGNQLIIYVWNAGQTVSVFPLESRDSKSEYVNKVSLFAHGAWIRLLATHNSIGRYGVSCIGSSAIN